MQINETHFPKSVRAANSYADLCRQYSISDNGEAHSFFKALIQKHQLSTSHWTKGLKNRKYLTIEKTCPVCNLSFSTRLGHKQEKVVCSISCSNTYFSNVRHTDTSKENTRRGMERYLLSIGKPLLTRNKWSGGKKIVIPLLKISCAVCGKKKMVKRISQKCCSNKCARLLLSKDPKYIQKLRDAQLKLIANGTHSGWKTRNILSYPEKFFITVLNNNGLRYTPNKPVNGYFLDFAIEEKMIDLEIDGKQHEYPERKVADTIRDSNLTKHGWKVYRIKWNEIKTDTGKQQMKEKIDAFLKMYENV